MTQPESQIRNISDTARWVAVYRARESERRDAVFRDPFARRLAGERGEQIAASIAFMEKNSWPFVARTWLTDHIISDEVRQGADMVINLAAGLDAQGVPVAWSHRLTGSSVIARWAPPFFQKGLDGDTIEGAAETPYAFPNMRVEYVRHEPRGIPTAFWRGVGPVHNVFVVESFIDELAAKAGKDPVAYRAAIADPRAKALLELAAIKAGWGGPLPKGIGRGVAVQSAFGSYLAQVAEVEVSPQGEVRVRRIVCAVDCGPVVNPDTVRAQMQSGIVYGLSAALHDEITLKDGRVEQTNFGDYRVLRINEMPQVDVFIVDSTAAPGGIGETATACVMPALTNAIFAATGKRIRKLPVGEQTRAV